jgi:hypothetical protein
LTYAPRWNQFRTALLGWSLLLTLIDLSGHRLLLGPGAYTVRAFNSTTSPVEWLVNLLSHPTFAAAYPAVFALRLAPLLRALFVQPAPWSLLIAYWAGLNLENAYSGALDGSDTLRQLLFFWLLVHEWFVYGERRTVQQGRSAPLAQDGQLFAVSMARGQLLLVYVVAGLAKLVSEPWRGGYAAYHILRGGPYSHPTWGPWLARHLGTSGLLELSTLVFELGFPFLVWSRRARPYLLVSGLFFHLGIGIVMGIPTFSVAVLIGYLLFVPSTSPPTLKEADR